MVNQQPLSTKGREIESYVAATVTEQAGELPFKSHAVYLFEAYLDAKRKEAQAGLIGDRDAASNEYRNAVVAGAALATEAAQVFNCLKWLADFELPRNELGVWELLATSEEISGAVIRKDSTSDITSYALYVESAAAGIIGMKLSEAREGNIRTFSLIYYKDITLNDVSSPNYDISTAEKTVLLSGQNSGIPSIDPFGGNEEPYFQLNKITEGAVMGGAALETTVSFAKHYSGNRVFV
jgi:hypothetical protein